MKKYFIPGIIVFLVLIGFFGFKATKKLFAPGIIPSPTPSALVQLSPEQYPQVSIQFSQDAHYATIKINNINANKLEYNLIYDAVIKKKGTESELNTGVNGAADLNGQKSYEKQQLLGSESSGKFTYHENIKNAYVEITLRDIYGRSIFFGKYPFTHVPGASQDLQLKSE